MYGMRSLVGRSRSSGGDRWWRAIHLVDGSASSGTWPPLDTIRWHVQNLAVSAGITQQKSVATASLAPTTEAYAGTLAGESF